MARKYTYESGRNIYRDGKRFVYVSIPQDKVTSERACDPTDADAFTRGVPEVIEAAKELLNRLEVSSSPVGLAAQTLSKALARMDDWRL